MGLWGVTTAQSDKPKFLPDDSNAVGAGGAKEHAIAVKGGWGLAPGQAFSGNDNTAADPEILVCVKNLAEAMGSASVIGIDWTEAEVADTGTFDIVVTFDEAVDVTSAAWSANQTITNKAYILLSRVGQTDMVEDSTMACMYFSGSGTNQLTFRGTSQTNAAAGYLAFNGQGVGDAGVVTGINFNGSATITEEDGASALGIRLEPGTTGAAANTKGDSLIANASAGKSATTNGAVSASTTMVLDGNVGTIAVGDVITVKDTTSLDISDSDGGTGISTDNTLTVAATNGSTSVTLSEACTIANNIDLLFSTDGGDEIIADALAFGVAGPAFATRSDIMTITKVGEDGSVAIALESGTTHIDGTPITEGSRIVQESGNAASNNSDGRNAEEAAGGTIGNSGDPIVVEESISDAATYTQTGSSSGSALVLQGMTVAAS